MHPVLFVTTAFLVWAFLVLCVGAWRIHRGRMQPRPFARRATIAIIFATVGLQALIWLDADQPQASQTRVVAVWLQLLSAFGISGVALASGRLVSGAPIPVSRTCSLTSPPQPPIGCLNPKPL
jgi:hypothetical protein